jgi:ATP-dependent DNA helicase 2 subunit 2
MKLIEEKQIGFCYDLEYANNYFSKFECKRASPSPWYSTLELGKGVNSLNIPIVGYIKITAYKRKTGSEAFVRPTAREDIQVSENNDIVEQKPGTNVSLTETPIEKVVTYKPNDEQSVEEVEKEEIISAYCYGSTLVPFDGDDKKSFSYQSTEKGFKIIGFSSVHNICAAHQIGDKTMIVIPDPRPKQNNHKLVFQTLVRAMLDKQEVAIVRYAYRDRSSLQIGYLQPYVEDNDVMMIYIQLPFDEDVRRYRFPSLEGRPQYCPTEPQLQAIDDLIDAMDLMNADVDEEGNTCEALQSDAIYDPFLQYWFQCLYHRQLYNNSNELPLPSEQLKDSIEPPIQIRKSAEKFLRKVGQKFPLDCIKDKAHKKRNQINITQETGGSESKRTKINEQNVDPSVAIENIKSEVNELIKSEVPFSRVGNQLEVSIKSFCNDFIDIERYGEHIIDLLKIYRKQSLLNNDPKGFNELMINHMKPFRGTTFWYLMLSHEIGLIGRTECQMSHVSQEDVENFTNLSDDYIKIESD